MSRYWSVPRATAFGAGAALAAMLLWMLMQQWPREMVVPYVVALILTAACGLYILIATYADSVRNPRRGVRIRPIRGFDIAAGLVLAVPSIWALWPYLPALT